MNRRTEKHRDMIGSMVILVFLLLTIAAFLIFPNRDKFFLTIRSAISSESNVGFRK